MYHNIIPEKGMGLTIGIKNFEAQCKFLASENYTTHHFAEILDRVSLEGRKNCMITFDDAYVHQLQFAVPILQKYKLKATFFVPLAYVGKTDEWNSGKLKIMTISELRSLPSDTIELAYHSYHHRNYATLTSEEITEDTQQCFDLVGKHELKFTKVLAYPFGKFPKKEPAKAEFMNQLQQHEIKLGLRIGNRVARFPFKNPFEINRIDVKGEWSLSKFKRKIRFGKLF